MLREDLLEAEDRGAEEDVVTRSAAELSMALLQLNAGEFYEFLQVLATPDGCSLDL